MQPTADRARHDLVVVSDHLPVDVGGDGHAVTRRRADSLSGTLPAVAADRGAAWIGRHNLADRTVSPFRRNGIPMYPVSLARAELADHLDGQCDATIAPLYHDSVEPSEFHRRWRQAYRRVNERYARAAAVLAAPGGVVWVHDYHLQLMPAMLRTLRPDLRIGFYLQVPFPPAELFIKLPLRRDIVDGVLGADLLGFQGPRSARNFRAIASELGGYQVRDDAVLAGGRQVRIDAFPLSVDTATLQQRARSGDIRDRATRIRAELGNPRTVLLSVDRLAPANGIEQRLHAYHELLAEGRLDPSTTVLVQVAVPDPQYNARRAATRAGVERAVAQINGRYAGIARPALHYVHQAPDAAELTALYLAADVLLATPLRAGIDLTAKEYVACRTDETGTVVLSEFTATAADFPDAIMVNPYDTDALKAAILDAVAAGRTSLRRQAMRAMREQVRRHDVHHWADTFLRTLGAATTSAPRSPAVPTDAGHPDHRQSPAVPAR
jgi:trehalose 6-phosphate synthase